MQSLKSIKLSDQSFSLVNVRRGRKTNYRRSLLECFYEVFITMMDHGHYLANSNVKYISFYTLMSKTRMSNIFLHQVIYEMKKYDFVFQIKNGNDIDIGFSKILKSIKHDNKAFMITTNTRLVFLTEKGLEFYTKYKDHLKICNDIFMNKKLSHAVNNNNDYHEDDFIDLNTNK